VVFFILFLARDSIIIGIHLTIFNSPELVAMTEKNKLTNN